MEYESLFAVLLVLCLILVVIVFVVGVEIGKTRATTYVV
jgi:hypothetical protein